MPFIPVRFLTTAFGKIYTANDFFIKKMSWADTPPCRLDTEMILLSLNCSGCSEPELPDSTTAARDVTLHSRVPARCPQAYKFGPLASYSS